jgi:hypothetical protein
VGRPARTPARAGPRRHGGRPARPASRAARRRHPCPRLVGGGLRRLLQLARARDERQPDLPTGRPVAAGSVGPPPDRLPRTGRHGGRQRHADHPPDGAPARPGVRRHRERTELAPRRRGGARVGGGRRQHPRYDRADDGLRGPRRRRRRRQRLERPGPAGVRVPPPRAVPRQVVRHLGVAVDRAARRARRRAGRTPRPTAPTGPPPRAGGGRVRGPLRARTGSRRRGRDRRCPARTRRACAGRRRSSSHTSPATARRCGPATCTRRAPCPGRRGRSGAACSSSPGAGPNRSPLAGGEERRDGLADGDEVTIRASIGGGHGRPVPLGEVSGRVAPAGARGADVAAS